MLETVFDQKSNVEYLSHKIQSKEKETKRYSKIRVKYNPSNKKLKYPQKYKSGTKKQK